MLVTMIPILEAAQRDGYCVAAPNYDNAEQLRMCIEAAEEMNSPIILDIGRFPDTSYESFKNLVLVSREMGKNAKVPVAINLDHGGSFEHLVQAIYAGCTSVMIDRSGFDYETNVKETKEIVRIAHACGCSVESELGHVGANITMSMFEDKEVIRNKVSTDDEKRKMYTDPNQAIAFVKETGVDCLAVAVGTVHGLYPKGFKPSLDIELLKELRNKITVPLVIHGGSGTGDELLKQLSTSGACKLNVGSDLFKARSLGWQKAFEEGDRNVVGRGLQAYKDELKHYIKVLGSENKAK